MSPEPWRWRDRPRVLLENPDGDASLVGAAVLRRAGCSVAVCPGPVQRGRQPERCPLIGPEGCALVDGADVIVTSLDLRKPDCVNVVDALRRFHPGTPLVVETSPDHAVEHAELLEGCDVIEAPARPKDLLAAVKNALGSAVPTFDESLIRR